MDALTQTAKAFKRTYGHYPTGDEIGVVKQLRGDNPMGIEFLPVSPSSIDADGRYLFSRSFRRSLALVFLALLLAGGARGDGRVVREVEYAQVDGESLKLDLYLPAAPLKPVLLVQVHGGGWGSGSKADMPLGKLLAQGFAVASVDYRLSRVAPFPAQIHDLKAAIRFLRAQGKGLGVDASRIAVVGESAGGHLAALVGVTNGVKELEGAVGGHLGQSSAVQAIISLFGASNLETILGQSTPHGLNVRKPALQFLLGGQPSEKPELARLASPVAHVTADDPPLLLIHGDADPQMPCEQSREFQHAYEALHLPVELEIIPGAKHGGPEFFDEKRIALMSAFLDRVFPAAVTEARAP